MLSRSQGIQYTPNLGLLAAAAASLQSCLTLRPQRWQPTRLPRPWDFPGKSTGVGCPFLPQCIHAKLLQLCLTLCDPMDSSPPGSSLHGILQARILGCYFLLRLIRATVQRQKLHPPIEAMERKAHRGRHCPGSHRSWDELRGGHRPPDFWHRRRPLVD